MGRKGERETEVNRDRKKGGRKGQRKEGGTDQGTHLESLTHGK